MKALRLFVISDLHLGGYPDADQQPGTQVCSGPERIAAFVDWLSEELRNRQEDVELVLNGDIFDFLCELEVEERLPADWATNEELALRSCERLVRSLSTNETRSPLSALKEFLANGGQLTVLIGNHDVELSFPRVRMWFEEALAVAGRRFRFIFDGEAYSCGDVLIEHGNRYDSWNIVGNDDLRRARSLMSRGLIPSAELAEGQLYQPPAGSLLVTYVYNKLKKRYRFLDLLKPETAAVIPLLLTLCPVSSGVLRELAGIAPRVAIRKFDARGAESGFPKSNYVTAADQHSNLEACLRDTLGPIAAQDFLAIVQEVAPPQGFLLAAQGGARSIPETLKRLSIQLTTAATYAALPVLSEAIVLRRLHIALSALPTRQEFSLGDEVEPYRSAAHRLLLTGRHKVVIFGHTHLAKYVAMDEAGGVYINTGTWADLMSLPAECLHKDFASASAPLLEFASNLAKGKYRQYVRRVPCFAEILVIEGRAAESNIWHFKDAASPRNVVYEREIGAV